MDPNIVQGLSTYFRHNRRGIHAVYLFGSHAEHRAHRESDVDVGVLLSWSVYTTREARSEARIMLSSALVAALHENDVQVIVLNDAPPDLGRQVVTRGLPVYVGDAEADHAFVRDVQLRAADVAPFLNRMRRIKLKALRS